MELGSLLLKVRFFRFVSRSFRLLIGLFLLTINTF